MTRHMSHPLTMHSSSLPHIPIIIGACPCTSAFGLTLPSILDPPHTLSPHDPHIPNPDPWAFQPLPMHSHPGPCILPPSHPSFPPFTHPGSHQCIPAPQPSIRLDWPMDDLVLGKVYQSEVSPAEHVHSHPHDYLCLHMTTIQTKWTVRCVGLHGIYGECSWLCH